MMGDEVITSDENSELVYGNADANDGDASMFSAETFSEMA